MPGLTIANIREAMAAQLRNNLDRETNVDAFGLRDKPFPRIRIVLGLSTPVYTTTYGGLATVDFRLLIEPAGIDESAVRRLDGYLSAGLGNNSSVIDALRADPTLGGVAQIVEINSTDIGQGVYDPENVTAELLVRVHVLKIRA